MTFLFQSWRIKLCSGQPVEFELFIISSRCHGLRLGGVKCSLAAALDKFHHLELLHTLTVESKPQRAGRGSTMILSKCLQHFLI